MRCNHLNAFTKYAVAEMKDCTLLCTYNDVLIGFLVQEKVLSRQDTDVSHNYLFQLIGLCFILITVSILAVGHAQAPNSQDAVDVVSYPGILLVMAG